MSESWTNNGPLLLQDVIIRRIFSYLNLRDLKVCRQVCSKWRYLSHPFLQQHRFRFRFVASTEEQMHVDKKESEEINLFLQNFEIVPPVIFTFQFSMKNGHVKLLSDILDRKRNNLKFVTINGMKKLNASKPYVCDISEAILAGNVASLTVTGRNISISMDSMSSIPEIDLEDCTIFLPKKRIPFAAKKLSLSSVYLFMDGKIPDKIVLDNFLQLQNLKYFAIYTAKVGKPLISLDMKSKLSLDTLVLKIDGDSVDTDWPFVNLTIKKLEMLLCRTPSSAIPNSVQLEKLEVLSLYTDTNINFIPKTIKRLTLASGESRGRAKWQRDENSPLRILPNLNYLKIGTYGSDENVSFLEHFGDAVPNLFQLCVHNAGQEILKLNVELIPPTAKQIKLIENVQFCGDNRIVALKSLILSMYQFEFIDDLFKHCKPKVLIITSTPNFVNDYLDKFSKLLEENKCERIAIAAYFVPRKMGNANTSKETDKCHRKVAKFCIFEKEKTSIINFEEFEQLYTC